MFVKMMIFTFLETENDKKQEIQEIINNIQTQIKQNENLPIMSYFTILYHILIKYPEFNEIILKTLDQLISINSNQDECPIAIIIIQFIHLQGQNYRKQGKSAEALKQFQKQKKELESLLKSDKELKYKQNLIVFIQYTLINCYINMGHCYQDFLKLEESIQILKQSNDLLKKYEFDNKLPQLQSQILNNSASVLQQQGKLDQSLEKYLQALTINQKIHEQHQNNNKDQSVSTLGNVEIAINLMNISTIYRELDNLEESITYGLKSLETFKVLYQYKPKQFAQQYATCLSNISVTYQTLGDFDLAIQFSEQSCNIFKEIPQCFMDTAMSYFNLSSFYECEDNIDKAISTAKQSISLLEKYLDKEQFKQYPLTCDIYEHIGSLYNNQQNIDKSNEYYYKSFEIREFQPVNEQFLVLCHNLTVNYQQQEDFGEAKFYAQQAIQAEKKLGINKVKQLE